MMHSMLHWSMAPLLALGAGMQEQEGRETATVEAVRAEVDLAQDVTWMTPNLRWSVDVHDAWANFAELTVRSPEVSFPSYVVFSADQDGGVAAWQSGIQLPDSCVTVMPEAANICTAEGDIALTLTPSQDGGWLVPAGARLMVLPPTATSATEQGSRIGIDLVPVDDAVAYHLGINASDAVMIASVEDDGPAARAGLMAFDVIIRFAECESVDADAIREHLELVTPGTGVSVRIRRGASELDHLVVTDAAPSPVTWDVHRNVADYVSWLHPGVSPDITWSRTLWPDMADAAVAGGLEQRVLMLEESLARMEQMHAELLKILSDDLPSVDDGE